jgi:type IV pilus assembly protein PilM
VNILEDGVPILTRDIPFGSRKIREDLQRERGLTAEQAEDVVQARESIENLDSFVEASADEVAVGIERASAFLMTREEGDSVGRIFLSGGGARVPGMSQTLARRMNVETEVVNPFERVPVRANAARELSIDEAAPMLLLPLGLALRA